MAYFPFMIDIKNKKCLVVGGGTIAFHKVKILSEYEVRIDVVSPKVCRELYALAEDYDTIEIHQRGFQDNDIEKKDFVVAATDAQDLNNHISKLCRQNNILVNAVDMKEACSFIFPALIKREDLLISVSSGGKSPAAAAFVKKKVENNIPDFYEKMIDTLGEYRQYIMENTESEKRKGIFNDLLQYGSEHNGEIPQEIVEEVLKKYE